ncbi:hypothetical protein [Amycolatopsis sp. NPDC051061]|uniref:hypothetical protein n=1 Tax=Amycolatopsis sp. NPDC051061 TaxID=3155042 RepID=UPI003426A95B
MNGSHVATALDAINPRDALLIIGCSKAKTTGGRPSTPEAKTVWSEPMLRARAEVLAGSKVDDRYQLPAWRRYNGHFYRNVGNALGEAIGNGRTLILSGGYGVVRGDEPIAYYDRKLKLRDWPPGLLERTLVEQTRRVGATKVIGFVSASADYAKLLRKTPWGAAGIDATLVTIDWHTGGAQIEVPRRLAQALSAWWYGTPADYPAEMIAESLR